MSQIPAKVTWEWLVENVLKAGMAKLEKMTADAARESLPDCDQCPMEAMCPGCGRRMEVVGWVEEVQRCYFVCRECDKIAWGEKAEGEAQGG